MNFRNFSTVTDNTNWFQLWIDCGCRLIEWNFTTSRCSFAFLSRLMAGTCLNRLSLDALRWVWRRLADRICISMQREFSFPPTITGNRSDNAKFWNTWLYREWDWETVQFMIEKTCTIRYLGNSRKKKRKNIYSIN